MADATSLTPPSPGLSATLFPNKRVESYSPKGRENVKITSLYRCTGRLFRAHASHEIHNHTLYTFWRMLYFRYPCHSMLNKNWNSRHLMFKCPSSTKLLTILKYRHVLSKTLKFFNIIKWVEMTNKTTCFVCFLWIILISDLSVMYATLFDCCLSVIFSSVCLHYILVMTCNRLKIVKFCLLLTHFLSYECFLALNGTHFLFLFTRMHIQKLTHCKYHIQVVEIWR